MFTLLNRFAWIISIILGLMISDYIGGFFRLYNSENLWIFIPITLLIKFLFLSDNFIKERLEFFANSLKENFLIPDDNIIKKDNNKTEKSKDIYFPLVDKEEEIKEFKIDNFQDKKVEEKISTDEYFKKEKEKTFAEQINKLDTEEEIYDSEPSKISIAISNFFAENLLAKLGGILVFMGVLFFLSLIYSAIGPVGKLIIGFAVGFSIYLVGIWLDKKDLPNEGRILLGIGILINYLVILSGRYLIGDSIDNNILSVGTTFLFLIFNTVFAVVTSLVYKSRTLLLFSFIFAFINPLLVGGNSDNPYTLVGYSLIVAFGGLFLSLKQKDITLAIGVFILSNILFLIAPFSSDIQWIVKLIGSAIVSISTIFVIYKIDKDNIATIFVGSYLFLVLLLGNGDLYIKETISFVTYMITIVLYFGIGIYYFLKTSFESIIFLLISPILIILGLSFSGDIYSIPLSLSIIILLYFIGFNFIKDKLAISIKYTFFIILGIYIFLSNSLLSFNTLNLDLISFITVLIVSFIFIFTSYYLSTKKDSEFLYSIGTVGAIFTLAPIIVNYLPISDIPGNTYLNQDLIKFYLSIISMIIFAISNWFLPFVNKGLVSEKNNIINLLVGNIAGILFIGFQLFSFGSEYFPGVSLGYAFTILAIIYFILAYSMMNKLGIENIKKDENFKNIIYLYLAISISIFSLAIALIFSNYESVISAIWLFEATIMFYLFNKTKEVKIYTAGIILFLIGVIKLFTLVDIVNTKDFIFLIPFSLIFISLILNIKFTNIIENIENRIFHDILHIIGISTLGILLLEIIPSTGHGWSTIGISVFLALIGTIYAYYNSNILKVFFLIGITCFLIMQIGELSTTLSIIDNEKLEYLRILQYASTFIMGIILLLWNKLNKEKSFNIYINSLFSIYLLIITSLYIYDIFNTTFAVTIYWGITASIFLFYGIAKDKIKLRTIGLYLITLTSGKIFLYDIWYGLDDAISRVAALIILGILFIIISTRYTKKYGNNITKELSFDNLSDNKKLD